MARPAPPLASVEALGCYADHDPHAASLGPEHVGPRLLRIQLGGVRVGRAALGARHHVPQPRLGIRRLRGLSPGGARLAELSLCDHSGTLFLGPHRLDLCHGNFSLCLGPFLAEFGHQQFLLHLRLVDGMLDRPLLLRRSLLRRQDAI